MEYADINSMLSGLELNETKKEPENKEDEDEILKITQSGMDISQNIFAKSRRFSR